MSLLTFQIPLLHNISDIYHILAIYSSAMKKTSNSTRREWQGMCNHTSWGEGGGHYVYLASKVNGDIKKGTRWDEILEGKKAIMSMESMKAEDIDGARRIGVKNVLVKS